MRFPLLALTFALSAAAAPAGDWIHWRGPAQNGTSPEKGLPETIGVKTVGDDGLVWKKPIGGRSAPLILGDKLFMITAAGDGITEGERVVCLNANTGETNWEHKFNVFHTDIVSSRLGWTTLTADPATGYVYCHGTQGHVFCFDTAGKIIWQRNLTEEYGRITGYGGRIVSPLFDSGLVIVGMVNTSWGDQARPANRFVAFDGKTGEVVWWADTGSTTGRTYYSIPILAVVNGQRLFVTGGADGAVHGFKVRTGEKVWSYACAAGAVNPSPVMDGNLLYVSHGEENPEPGTIGRVMCLDVSKVDPKTKKPALVWEVKNLSRRFGLASPALADGILYVPSDEAELYAFDAKKGGRPLWKFKYGTVSRGAPLVVDGKMYVFDVNAKMVVLKLNGKKEPEELQEINFKTSGTAGFVETHGTPIAVNGRLYFMTREDTYCVGAKTAVPTPAAPPVAGETPFAADAAPVGIRLFPADVVVKPGGSAKFTVVFTDANGREVKAPADAKPEWSFPTPPAPAAAPKAAVDPAPKAAPAGPPALKAAAVADGLTGTVTVEKLPSQQGFVAVKVGTLTARGRVRVAPQIPYMNDFEKIPDGAAPAGWVNGNGKFLVKTIDGKKVLAKLNTNPSALVAKSIGFITLPDSTGYVIQCDVMGTLVKGKIPDAGVVNSRYSLVLDGKDDPEKKQRTLRLTSWEARPRVNQAVALQWEPGVWYTLKLAVEYTATAATVRGKVWKTADAEPADWTVTFEDPSPNREGAAGIFGYVSNITADEPGSDIYYDNLKITPAGK